MHKYMAYRVLFIDEEKDQQNDFMEYMEAAPDVEVICVYPEPDLERMIQKIDEIAPDAIVSDFLLNDIKLDISYTVKYTGSELVNEYQKQRPAFPCFVLTSYDDRAVTGSNDVNVVYVKDLLHNNGEAEAKAKFYEKIKEQINKYRKAIQNAQSELNELLEKKKNAGLTLSENERLVELDDFLEKSLDSYSALPKDLKRSETLDMLSKLIENVDLLIAQNK